ncbi:MAG: thio(seleno)oxazole modification radical SAM maturase SbtM [Pseudomonadota bacterium]
MSKTSIKTDLQNRYPVCLKLLPDIASLCEENAVLSEVLEEHPALFNKYPYLLDLAKIEESKNHLLTSSRALPENVTDHLVNPALELLQVKWKNLPELFSDSSIIPEPGEEYLLVLIKPGFNNVKVRKAKAKDLLALKIVSENIDPRQAATEGNVTVGTIDNILHLAEQSGLIIAPATHIKRSDDFPVGEVKDSGYFSSKTFTLQWHITQTCDLNCRHCYDRSDREIMTLEQGLYVLDDLYDFCQEHHVFGQVSFSGGNPLLYPHFNRLYSEAADRGFMTAILGNPMPGKYIDKMLEIQKPEFYQVSLEGLKDHNDYIRGYGHFDRAFDFLKLLGEKDIYRMVMLTLTNDNMDQVIELADHLQGLTELFTFNRIATVGRGAELTPVPPSKFQDFLARYMDAAKLNPCMGYKDNLFNIMRWQQGLPLAGGCAGHGCGAAFNFVALLPDGEVHACRKMPSLIGNIYKEKLSDIYDSLSARKYRAGSKSCSNCSIRPVCGGCPAVSYGLDKDINNDCDPYCFITQKHK